jgi:hypothetical protein
VPASEKARAAKRARNRAAYQLRKNDPAFIEKNRRVARDAWRRDPHGNNEKRSAKNHRLGSRRLQRDKIWRRAGLYIASRDSLENDRTEWRGPGARREKRISELADKILRAIREGKPLDTQKIQEQIERIERGQRLADDLVIELRQDKTS